MYAQFGSLMNYMYSSNTKTHDIKLIDCTIGCAKHACTDMKNVTTS